jgi:endonuclease/exonuclease/phosphatase family metal-dependent hydrolase
MIFLSLKRGVPTSIKSKYRLNKSWSRKPITETIFSQDRDPDIICLQEVGEGMYQDLKKRLVDYESTLGLATSSSFGCATFFKSKKLSISRQTTCYNVLGVNKEHKRARVVAHFTSLESAETGQNFVVCNIHLLYGFSPYMEKMRGLSVKHIKEVIECYYGKSPQVVCGDFNSKPASQAVQAAAESGLVDVYHQVLSQDPEMTVEVYQHGEPIAVDYVFTTDDFVPLEVLQMPSILSTRRLQLPIPGFEGSDHLYQLVRVFLKPTTRG